VISCAFLRPWQGAIVRHDVQVLANSFHGQFHPFCRRAPLWDDPAITILGSIHSILSAGRNRLPRRPVQQQFVWNDPSVTIGIHSFSPQGAIVYHDGQFNDSRLAIMLACTAAAAGATVLNHAEAVKLIKASCSLLLAVSAI